MLFLVVKRLEKLNVSFAVNSCAESIKFFSQMNLFFFLFDLWNVWP